MRVSSESEHRYEFDEVIHPFILMGNSSAHKIIYFYWPDQDNKIKLQQGEYELRLYLWLTPKTNVKPDKIRIHQFTVDEDHIEALNQSLSAAKEGGVNPYTKFSFDGTREYNQFLSAEERKSLYDV